MPAATAGELHPALVVVVNPIHRDDANRDRNDPGTQKHHHRGQHRLSYTCSTNKLSAAKASINPVKLKRQLQVSYTKYR